MEVEFDTLSSADLSSSGSRIIYLPDEYGFYGQTFTATSENLSTVEFAVDHANGSGPVEMTVMIATVRSDAGGFHPDDVVFQSALITIYPDADNDGSIISVDTSGTTLVPGERYVILFNANSGDGPEWDGSLSFFSNPQNDSEYFVYNHTRNQDDQQAFDENYWYQNPADGSGWGDIAIRLSYESVNVIDGTPGDDTLIGTTGDDQINGYDGHDYMRGAAGNDELNGGDGDDYLSGGEGDDTLDGGAGYDRAAFSVGATGGVTVDLNLQGSAQDTGQGMDTLTGIENVSGTRFNDTIIGDGGDNWLWGGSDGSGVTGDDTISGGDGNDLIEVGTGNHTLDGGGDNDTLSLSGNGTDITPDGVTVSLALQGGAQDTEQGSMTLTGFENLSGSNYDDNLTGDGGDNLLAGDAGNDALAGGDGNDTLYGDGAVTIDSHGTGASGPIVTIADTGAAGDDTIEGGLGDDYIDGGAGVDTASYANALGGVGVWLGGGYSWGADGDDTLVNIENVIGSDHGDEIYGDDNANSLDGGAGNDVVWGEGGDDTLYGGDGHDGVRGGAGNDTLYGGAGDDLLYGNAGDDYIDGGDGYDRVGYYSGATAGVTVDLNLQGTAQDTGQGWDTLVNIENVSGTVFGDTLIGDGNDNVLWGSAATISPGNVATTNNDTLIGGGGNDLLMVGIGNHVVDGGDGVDTFSFTENGAPETGITLSLLLQGSAQASGNGSWTLTGIENLSGSVANDSLTGDANANVLAGSAGDDTLSGGDGNDTLYGDGDINWDTHGTGASGPIVTTADTGAAGNDTLEGGLGNDYIDGGAGVDTASYVNALGAVFVNLGGGFASGADGFDTLVNIENAIGSDYDDNLTGNFGDNVLSGGGGNDFIVGRAGNDTVDGGAGQDLVRGDAGDDILIGGDGSDNLRGGSGVDSFDGGDHDAGYTLIAGWGDRVSFYEVGATQGVVANLRTGIISNDGFGNVETMTGIESLGADTAFVDTFYGNDERNLLMANLGDYLYGFGGDDDFYTTSAAALVDGGDGIDTLALGSGGGWLMPDADADGFAESAAATTGGWVINLTTGYVEDGYGNTGSVAGIENVDGSENGDTLTGDAGANILNGWDGDDVLEGAGGDDTLDGGVGTDTASYVNAAGGVEAYLYAGVAFGADGSDTLANIENLTGSAYGDVLFGDGGANVLSGEDGNDTLVGLGGNDTLDGGAGHDYLEGNGGADALYGGADDDYLYGNAGDDLIDGGAGYDRAGFSAGATAGVTVDLNLQGTAQNTGQGWDTLVGIEHVSGTRFSDTITGDAGDNWLWGGSDGSGVTGDDTISAGDGNDLVTVGAGNHTLDGGSGNDTLSLYGNSTDISSAGVTFSLALQGSAQDSEQGMMNATGFENLVGSIYDDSLTGDAGDNILAGVEGDDTLIGGDGNDTLYGDGSIYADTHGTGRSGPIVTVADTGAAGNDVLIGGKGDDSFYGGGGDDVMTGGQGRDTFVFGADSGDDVITDFGGGQDTILFEAESGVTDFSQLTFTKSGNSVIVTWGTDDSIVLEGVKPKDISAASFQFEGSSLAAMALPEFDKGLIVDSWSGPTDYLI